MKKYSIISLGCSKNLVDSEIFSYQIGKAGYIYTEDSEAADVIIINTCGFILDAKEESLETILEACELKKNGSCKKIIVTGCLVQRYKTEIKASIPEIDEIIDLKDFNEFSKLFETEDKRKRKLLTLPHFAYLRISDGCNNHCSYCVIPSIRGKLKSVPIEKLIEETKYLAKIGVKELIITAQDTAAYGIDIYGEYKLTALLEQLHQIEGIEWIRILYLHPAHITKEIIHTISTLPKICKYFEIPIQHISDNVLKSMNRHVSKKAITNTVKEIREKIPSSVIRTTIITGYPGETEADFKELKDFIEEAKFERLGVFTYSQEEGTKAAKLKMQVSEDIAEQRKEDLMLTQQVISEEFLAKMIGKKIDVIIDRRSEDENFIFEGRSYFDSPEIDGVVFITEGEAEIGDIVKVKIIDSWEYDLVGKIERR